MFKWLKKFWDKQHEFNPQPGQLYAHNEGTRLHRWIVSVDEENETYEYALISDYGRRKKKTKSGTLSHLESDYRLAQLNFTPHEIYRDR